MYYLIQTTSGYPETIAQNESKRDLLEMMSKLMTENHDRNVFYDVADEPYGQLFHGLDMRTI